jgi:transcriptional regulator with XRE-family HTH domain
MGRTNATACYRELGAELKNRRNKAGLTGDDITRATGWHRSKVSRVELGQTDISVVDAIHYLGACKIFAGEARDLLKLCVEAERGLGYWLNSHEQWLEESLHSLIFHESTADRLIGYEPLVLPGLLQTPDYARVWISRHPTSNAEVIDAGIRSRMARKQTLQRPANFVFFVHEQALRLQVGSAAVMHEQLLHLVLTSAMPNVTLRVLPASAAERSMFGGPFRLFEYRDHHSLVYLDGPLSGLFLDDPGYVNDYRNLLPDLASVALDEGQSRSMAAELADQHDRRSHRRDAGIYELEEEHV